MRTETIVVDVVVEADPVAVVVMGPVDEEIVLEPDGIEEIAQESAPERPGNYHLTIEYEGSDVTGIDWVSEDERSTRDMVERVYEGGGAESLPK